MNDELHDKKYDSVSPILTSETSVSSNVPVSIPSNFSKHVIQLNNASSIKTIISTSRKREEIEPVPINDTHFVKDSSSPKNENSEKSFSNENNDFKANYFKLTPRGIAFFSDSLNENEEKPPKKEESSDTTKNFFSSPHISKTTESLSFYCENYNSLTENATSEDWNSEKLTDTIPEAYMFKLKKTDSLKQQETDIHTVEHSSCCCLIS